MPASSSNSGRRFPLFIALLMGIVIALVAATAQSNPPLARGLGVGGIVLFFVLVVFALSRRRAKRTRSTLIEGAEALGLVHQEQIDTNLHCSFGELPGIPSSGNTRRVLTGSIDHRDLTVIEHLYYINTGQAVVGVYHTAYLTTAGHWPLIRITRRRRMSRLLGRLGLGKGLALEDERFNRTRAVRTDDEDFAIALLNPEMQAFLAERPDIAWRFGEGYVAMIYNGRLRTDRMERSLERLQRFWELVPVELR